jgi:peroxiredoxin Q/BCP
MPRIGEPAPQFSLPTDGNGRANLSDYAGKKIVLYFYPKDDTPGCTKEACDFRDNLGTIKGAGAEVLGISPDSSSSHDDFKAKYQLPFPLLVDEDHAVAEAYGAWKEKTLYGRTFMGVERTTVLIDEHQKIAGVWNRVQVDGHAAHVIAVLKGEQPAPQPVDASPSKPVSAKPEPKAAAKPAAPVAKPAAAAKPAAKPAAKKAPAAKKKPAPKAKKAAPKKKAAAKKPAKKAAKKPAKKAAPKGKK